MRKIALGRDAFCIVDEDDYTFLSQWKWKVDKDGYAVRNTTVNGKHRTVRMARLIAKTPDDMEVDHINRNRLDNRKSNLRNCTRLENARNQKRPIGSLGYRGIRYRPGRFKKNWQAYIRVEGKTIDLGRFATVAEAQAAYLAAVKLYHGEFANTERLK